MIGLCICCQQNLFTFLISMSHFSKAYKTHCSLLLPFHFFFIPVFHLYSLIPYPFLKSGPSFCQAASVVLIIVWWSYYRVVPHFLVYITNVLFLFFLFLFLFSNKDFLKMYQAVCIYLAFFLKRDLLDVLILFSLTQVL